MKKFLFFFIVQIIFLAFASKINAQTWQECEKLMLDNFQSGNNQKAIEYGEKAIGILKDINPTGVDYGAVLNNLAYVYVEVKDYEKAEKAYLEVLDIITPVLGKEHKVYARTINYLGEIYLYTNQLDKAESSLLEAYKIRKKLLPATKTDCRFSLSLLKKLYIARHDYQKGLNYLDSTLVYIKNSEGQNSIGFIKEIYETIEWLNKNGGQEKAIKLVDELTQYPQVKNAKTKEELKLTQDIVFFYRLLSQYKKAINTCQSLIKNTEMAKSLGTDLVNNLNLLGLLYYENGQFEKSQNEYYNAIQLIKKNGLENSSIYALVLYNIGVLRYYMGNYIEAEQYYLKSLELREKLFSKNNSDYVSTLNGLGALYFEWGNIEKAEKLYFEGLNILEKQKLYDRSYFSILVNIGDLFRSKGDVQNSADYFLKAYKVGEKLIGRNNLEFAYLLKKIADLYKKYGHFSMAEPLYNECLECIQNAVGKNHPLYAAVLNGRGNMYLYSKDYVKAEKDLLESAEFNRIFYGDYHLQYAVSLNNLAALHFLLNDKKKTEKYFISANEILIDQINNYLAYMTGQQAEAYLQSTDFLFDAYFSFYLMEGKRNEALAGFAYDNILARKGLMLQSETNLRNSIIQSKNSSILKLYNEFVDLKGRLAKFYIVNNEDDKDSILILKDRISALEKKLATSSDIFKERNKYNFTGWDDVKKGLREKEACIEFIRFRFNYLQPTDSIFYCALILRPDYKIPKMVYLFEEKELLTLINKKNVRNEEKYIGNLYHKTKRNEEGIKPDNDSISNKLNRLIWQPLEKYLDGVNTIFYSPAGVLNNISFAALSINDSTYLSDKYQLNTLLSTRNLLKQEKHTPLKDYRISLYGGIEYDLQPDELKNITRAYKRDSNFVDVHLAIKNLLKTNSRGENWNYLNGTLEEVEAIEELYKNKDVEVNSFKGKNAVEETFKQYNGSAPSPNIIHIATHGFFFANDTTIYKSNAEDVVQRNVFRMSGNPLVRSGLLFAGANLSWNNQQIPSNVDDGILTALEVTNTNLTNTDLVVLSACETGLGEINGSEGVFGLQRSFKIAGAEYIIMSLWQIPDYQTVELMKAFYRYKNLDISIPEAFQQAQNEMKRKYLPYYWAAFVLIK